MWAKKTSSRGDTYHKFFQDSTINVARFTLQRTGNYWYFTPGRPEKDSANMPPPVLLDEMYDRMSCMMDDEGKRVRPWPMYKYKSARAVTFGVSATSWPLIPTLLTSNQDRKYPLPVYILWSLMIFFAYDFVGAKELWLSRWATYSEDDAKDEELQPAPEPLQGQNSEKNTVAQRAHFCKEFSWGGPLQVWTSERNLNMNNARFGQRNFTMECRMKLRFLYICLSY